MSKVITLRLSEDEYKKISRTAKIEFRTISNFITAAVLSKIEETCYTDAIESFQISTDKQLQQKLRAGHADAAKRRGRLVG